MPESTLTPAPVISVALPEPMKSDKRSTASETEGLTEKVDAAFRMAFGMLGTETRM